MSARGVRTAWGLLGTTPAVLLIAQGLGSLGLVCAGVYAFGWILLRRALARDPHATVIAAFARSRSAAVGLGTAFFLVQVIAFLISIAFASFSVLVLGVLFFLLWARKTTGEALAASVARVTLLAIALTIVLGLGEIFFRLPPVIAKTGGGRPGIRAWKARNYDGLWHKNPLRLRSFHTEEPKREGVTRILTLGDSFTWGDKIPRTEDVWPYVVERFLRNQDSDVQVINLGHVGYTTVNEAEALDRLGWSFDPDCIVLQYTINDPLPSGPNFRWKHDGWLFPTWPLLPYVHQSLNDKSFLYSYLNQRFARLQIRLRYPEGYRPLYRDDYEGWKATKAAFRGMADQARKRNTPMLVVIFPYFVRGSMDAESYPLVDLHEKVASAAQEAGLQVFDLRSVYAKFGRDGRSWRVFESDFHPGIEGHKVAGEAIARKIRELGMIP